MQEPTPLTSTLAAPVVRGGIDLVQGVYGEAGNLELVSPHPADGFLVLWFNGDDVDHRSGAVRRRWSRPLHVATGALLDAARISQVPFGPDFLEVVAWSATGTTERWTWSPAGFAALGALPSSSCAPTALVAHDGRLHQLVAAGDRLVHRIADVDDYPALGWRDATPPPPVPAPPGSLDLAVVGGTLRALVLAAGVALRSERSSRGWSPWRPAPEPWRRARLVAGSGALAGIGRGGPAMVGGVELEERVDDVAAVRSTLDGGMIEVVARRGDALLHARIPRWTPGLLRLEPLHPVVWPPLG